ncbi:unnamed protein product [Musa textilis]
MLTRRGGWELSSSASFCAALLLLHVAVVLPGVVSSQSLKNSNVTATFPWLTLSGDTPLVIAKGGFSGLFPDSSSFSYKFSYVAGSPDTISWCDVRLTKDGNGICLPDIVLDNCTNIKLVYPEGKDELYFEWGAYIRVVFC